MKNKILYIIVIILLLPGYLAGQALPVVAPAQSEPIMLKGGTIHTGTGEVIENGFIIFSNGKITLVGEVGKTDVPDEEYKIFDVTGKDVYPGLILTNSNLGLSEIGSVEETQDSREFGNMNPGVRTQVAYNTDSHVIPVVRSNGILLAQVVPSGGVLSGTSSVMQLDAWNWEDAVYKADNGIHISWPRMSSRGRRRRSFSMPGAGGNSSNFDNTLRDLESFFSEAASYCELDKPERTNLKFEALRGLFDGSKTLFINVSESKGIVSSVNFAEKHGVKKIVLVGVGEEGLLVKDFLAEHNVPVILANVFSMPSYEDSDTRMPFKVPQLFNEAGILAGISFNGSASAYNLPFAAGQAVAYGLPKEEALKMITLNNAKILGIDDRTGSLEKGKDANIVVSTGDILDMMTNNIELAFINGRNINLDNKFKMLYRRFQEKYKQ